MGAPSTPQTAPGVVHVHAGNGYGLQAESLGQFGYGLFSTGGSYGGFFQGNASQAGSTGVYSSGNTRGVDAFSEATTGTSYGVFADADAVDGGTGVHGRADGGTGVNFGVRGEVYSPDGYGGYFENQASGNNGAGVAGLASDTTANGVPDGYFAAGGEFTGGNGVIGVADRASGYGVVGLQGPGQYAGYFVGNTHVSGTLSKSAGSFKIDHPLDPENKYLSHSFVESPDMKNIYDGSVTLDDDGARDGRAAGLLRGAEPRLPLPAHRDRRARRRACSRRRRSRTTASRSRGGEPGMKVSWQVTGIRQDAYANANRIQVEEDKPASERGDYLYPGVFGRSASRNAGAQTSGNVRHQPKPVPEGDPKPKRP